MWLIFQNRTLAFLAASLLLPPCSPKAFVLGTPTIASIQLVTRSLFLADVTYAGSYAVPFFIETE
jgi:hypothetical protein